ncbi:integrase catalytic domain-containing protein [Trichonephila clavipes]|nr:integrase catalytic domain-containing protein [Trichonephila clavipes]
MNRKIDELKDQYYDIKDISESELQVIEADIQSMEDRLEELESQKLYYLKASLQGDAKLLEAVDDSFESLITALKTRFENKRLLTETHIIAILEIEKLTSESARDIRTMTDIISKNIRALKLLGFERNNLSDLILLNIILKKIDRKTRKQFEQSIDSNQIPELDTFIMFLEKRSQTIDSINRSALITHKPKQVPFHKELLIVPYITTTSIHRMDATKVNIPSNIDLADKDFGIPGEIDMLIGCELFFELLRPNKFRSPCEKWLFQETVFGYIVVGSFDKFEEKSYCGLAINAEINSDNLNQQLQAFWEIEKVDESSIEHSLEEEICETQYQNTHYRTEEGRYVVQLPLKKDPYCLVLRDGPVQTYKLNTVTYGTTCAPYLATRTIQQLARDEGEHYPLAASVTIRDIYMDDILTGSSDFQEFQKLQLELNSLFKKAGIIWSPQFDYFSFKTVVNCRESYSKIEVLSIIARLFDPLGFLGPILTQAKLILQKLWVLKLEWDEPLSNPIAKEWNDFVSTLPVIQNIHVPRLVIGKGRIIIHGFADASTAAYGAVLYAQ